MSYYVSVYRATNYTTGEVIEREQIYAYANSSLNRFKKYCFGCFSNDDNVIFSIEKTEKLFDYYCNLCKEFDEYIISADSKDLFYYNHVSKLANRIDYCRVLLGYYYKKK